MGRSGKIRLVVFAASSVLLAVVIGVVRCDVSARSDDEETDGGSSSSRSGSIFSNFQAYSGHAGSGWGHGLGLTPFDREWWCEGRWGMLLTQWEALLIEIAADPNHPDYDHIYRSGGYDFEYADGDIEDDYYEDEDDDDGDDDDDDDDLDNVEERIMRVLRECKSHRKILLKKAEAVYLLNRPSPPPVNLASTAASSCAGGKTWEERVDSWMLWWRQVVGVIVLAACVSLVPLPGMKPYQLLQVHSKDPEIGIRYFSKTIEYYYVAIAASVRRVVGGGTSSKQRTRDTAQSEALLREIETLYAKVQSTNRTEGAERRLAQLRLRSAWAALNLARLSGNKATEKRDAAIRKAISTKTLILLRAQRRSPEGAQQVEAAAPSI